MTGSAADVLLPMRRGKIALQGEFLWGSNYTFLVEVGYHDATLAAVYKPTRGERPLWDFPTATLARREVAAYLVSEALGWELVPPTVYRVRGPLGPGSLQLYIEHDPEAHYFNFSPETRQRLRPVALFDLLINNADRKGSHVLLGQDDDHLWLIDHGLCFHVEDKLRTVIWDFVGEPIPANLCADLERFGHLLLEGTPEAEPGAPSDPQTGAPPAVAALRAQLAPEEITALAERALKLAHDGTFPAPNPFRRPYPLPQI